MTLLTLCQDMLLLLHEISMHGSITTALYDQKHTRSSYICCFAQTIRVHMQTLTLEHCHVRYGSSFCPNVCNWDILQGCY